MKVTAERLPESQARLEIVSDQDEWTQAFEKATRRVAQRVTVPGFRRGKAPRQLVERFVGRDAIISEANGDLMDDLYRKALEQEDLTPVTRPEVELVEQEPLSFRVNVEIAPTADVTGYENVRVEPEHISLTDADVDEQIARAREEASPWVDPPTPRPVQEGDQVVVDIAAFDGDEPFDEPTTGATFVMGRDNLLPQVRDLIIGATVGEPVERTITFPDANPATAQASAEEGESARETSATDGEAPAVNDEATGMEAAGDPSAPTADAAPETVATTEDADTTETDGEDEHADRPIPEQLLGKTLNYRVTVQSVKEREMLPLDDELPASLGAQPETLDQFRVEVRANLYTQRETQARVDLINKIMEQLRETTTVEIGPALVQQATQDEAGRQLQQIGGMGLDINEIFGKNSAMMENFMERIRPEAEQRLRNTLIVQEIAKHEDVTVTPEDIHEEVHRLGMSHSVLDDPRTVELIKADLQERALFDRLIAIATEGKGIIDDSPATQYIAAATPDGDTPDDHDDHDHGQSDTGDAADAEPTMEEVTTAEAPSLAEADAEEPAGAAVTDAESAGTMGSETPTPATDTATATEEPPSPS